MLNNSELGILFVAGCAGIGGLIVFCKNYLDVVLKWREVKDKPKKNLGELKTPIVLNKTIIKLCLMVLIYLLTWLICAYIYQDQANKTEGKAFYYNQDILLKFKQEKFAEVLRFPISTEKQENFSSTTLESLSQASFGNIEINKFFTKNLNNKLSEYVEIDESHVLYTGNILMPKFQNLKGSEIGGEWADFYYNMFKELGITHYKYNKISMMTQGNTFSDGVVNYYYIFSLYIENEIFSFGLTNFNINATENKKYDLVFKIFLKVAHNKIEGDNSKYIPYKFSDIFKKSEWFIDDSVVKYNRIMNGKYVYPLIDFLYFSAVTITTLGYGDILPNNSVVRKIVIFESFFGITLLIGIITLMTKLVMNNEK